MLKESVIYTKNIHKYNTSEVAPKHNVELFVKVFPEESLSLYGCCWYCPSVAV